MNPKYRFSFREYGTTGNLLNPAAVSIDTYLNNGVEVGSSVYNTSDFMPVQSGPPYYFIDAALQSKAIDVATYDANKNYLGWYSGSMGIMFFASGVAFVRVVFSNTLEAKNLCFVEDDHTFYPYGYIVTRQVYPIWNGQLAKDFTKESGQQFFREALSAKIIFSGPDYNFITSKPLDYEFILAIEASFDGGATWADYYIGKFWKTDCEFNMDDETVSVLPKVRDLYAAVLEGQEKEYDLIKLGPEIVPVKMDKRPMVQVYVAGDSVIGCFLSGMWWEQSADSESDHDTLEDDYHFAFCKSLLYMMSDDFEDNRVPFRQDTLYKQFYDTGFYIEDDKYRLEFSVQMGVQYTLTWKLYIDGVLSYVKTLQTSSMDYLRPPYEIELSGTGGSTITIFVGIKDFYMRVISDTDTIAGLNTVDIPSDDLVADNRNYHKCIGYDSPTSIIPCIDLSSEPSEWGIYQPGTYYLEPYVLGGGEFYPISRNNWGRISYWYAPSVLVTSIDQTSRARFTLKNAYPLAAAIKVLLGQIAPEIEFEETSEYSQFLFGENPLTGTEIRPIISPKSNLVVSEYDKPAQTAPITLKQIFDMLRDCFRCYWYLDGNKLKIEHIYFFMLGGSYDTTPSIGIDLTSEIYTRSGKSPAAGQSVYSYLKPDMPERYQFAWMDEVTQPFNGWPIEIVSNFVQKGRVDDISVSGFTSDVDYILLSPGEVSKDGFVLLGAVASGDDWVLPYLPYQINLSTQYELQNGYMSFYYLQTFYKYDLPAPSYKINGQYMYAYATKRSKTQKVKFPILADPNLMLLIKTFVGVGMFEKLSVNLSDRTAEADLRFEI